MYSIEFTETAKDFLKKIPKQDSGAILKKLDSIKENPFLFLKRLHGHKLWRLRTLKYRVIVDVIVSGEKIIVLRVGFRKNIYGKL